MTQILQDAEVTNGFIYLKFKDTIQLASIVPDAFSVATDAATPVVVSDPFNDFTIANNYNTVSRSLKLYWNDGALDPNTDYVLTISGLKDAAGRNLDTSTLNFTTEASVDPDDGEIEPPAAVEIIIDDYSIITDIDFSETEVLGDDDALDIVSSVPVDGAFLVDNDANNGRVSITFTETPSLEKVSTRYFKGFRKKIQRAPIKWESLAVVVSADSSGPIVNVDFPSLDDDPVYYTSGSDYFEDGYKYKIMVSKGLST